MVAHDERCPKCKHTLEDHDNMGWTCDCQCPWKRKFETNKPDLDTKGSRVIFWDMKNNSNQERYYAEYDDETGFWCVFGEISGKAVESWSDEETAKTQAQKRNRS